MKKEQTKTQKEIDDENTANLYKSRHVEMLHAAGGTLLPILHDAHYNATLNNPDNISRKVFEYAYSGSGSLIQAISAGISSIGDRHAPLEEARALIIAFKNDPKDAVRNVFAGLAMGQKIPGFGNSFFKDGIDPSFAEAYDAYTKAYFEIYPDDAETLLDSVLKTVNEGRMRLKPCKPIYPNAAGITAAICELCNLYLGTEVALFVEARVKAWVVIRAEYGIAREEDDHPELPLED